MVCPHQVVYEFHLLHTAESRAGVFRYLVACFGEGKTAAVLVPNIALSNTATIITACTHSYRRRTTASPLLSIRIAAAITIHS